MNLGIKTGPMLLFGGPYSNFHAISALQQVANELDIPARNIICTGDTVAYCAQPVETVEFIQQWGIHVLMGNCEESFAANASDCGCGFEEGSQCDLLSAGWFNFANQQLHAPHRQWFAQLPKSLFFSYHGRKVEVVHGSISSINQFLFPSDADSKYDEQLSQTTADVIVAGHSGIPFSKRRGKKLWHNAGAIGMPANDGQQATWFSLLSEHDGGLIIETKPLRYHHQASSQAMADAGLENGYRQCLETGLWPSIDVLPNTERNNRGVALKAFSTYF